MSLCRGRSQLKKARPVAGVQSAAFRDVRDAAGLVPLVLAPHAATRPQGGHDAQPVPGETPPGIRGGEQKRHAR